MALYSIVKLYISRKYSYPLAKGFPERGTPLPSNLWLKSMTCFLKICYLSYISPGRCNWQWPLVAGVCLFLELNIFADNLWIHKRIPRLKIRLQPTSVTYWFNLHIPASTKVGLIWKLIISPNKVFFLI